MGTALCKKTNNFNIHRSIVYSWDVHKQCSLFYLLGCATKMSTSNIGYPLQEYGYSSLRESQSLQMAVPHNRTRPSFVIEFTSYSYSSSTWIAVCLTAESLPVAIHTVNRATKISDTEIGTICTPRTHKKKSLHLFRQSRNVHQEATYQVVTRYMIFFVCP